MKPGPKPTPANKIKFLTTRQAAKRGEEPKPEPTLRDPPEWLIGDALLVWQELAPQLNDMGVLTRIDKLAFARYCTVFVAWREAEAFIKKHGKVYPVLNADGTLKIMRRSPYVEIANEAARQMSRLEAEFGLTPSSRSSIEIAPPRSNNPYLSTAATCGPLRFKSPAATN